MTLPLDAALTDAFAAIREILDDMGIEDPAPDRPLLAPASGTARPVLESDARFGEFMTRFCVRLGCLPYAIEAVRSLSIAALVERYVGDSHPAPPRRSLSGDSPAWGDPIRSARRTFPVCEFRVCFVLGSARSGTTLLQAMLNRHPALWAPGELHLATFDTMAERANGVGNLFLRGAFVPEAAHRLGESPDAFAARLDSWEQRETPTVDVYRGFAEADPGSAVVDKTPTYSQRRADLEWIQHHFPDARFVHLVRHPLDVAASSVRMQLHREAMDGNEVGLDPYHRAEASWYRLNDNVVSVLAGVPPERWCRIRYEDLVRDPASALERVCEVLGVDYVDRVADPYADRVGPVALGAGDPSVNRRRAIEVRTSTAPWFPLGEPSRRLAIDLGYDPPGTGG